MSKTSPSSISTLLSGTRREFIATGVTAGFALAVSPVTALAISTPLDGIFADTVKIPTKNSNVGDMPAYWAMPQNKGAAKKGEKAGIKSLPVVIVVHEIFGVHAYIQDVCHRLAKAGYLAIAPYLYFREGDVTKLESIDKIRPIVQKVPQAQVWSDLDAVMAWLKTAPAESSAGNQADLKRAAITGFCWGGNVVWTYAAQNPQLKAGIAWYGRLVGDPTPLQSKFPVDFAPELKVPVLGLYGGKDEGIPAESIEAMRKALAKGKSGSQIIVYPEAQHGFHADYRPSYNEKAAQEGWKQMLAWLKLHGCV